MPAKVLSIDVPTIVRLEHTMNVVGIVEGRDPALKNEYVALGAHLDHLGRTTDEKRQKGGDDINNGADDDGSGVVALMTMAGAVAKGPRPKRSLALRLAHRRGVWELGGAVLRRLPTGADRSHRGAAERGHDWPCQVPGHLESRRWAAHRAQRGLSGRIASPEPGAGRYLRRRQRRLHAPEVQLQVRRPRRPREDLHAKRPLRVRAEGHPGGVLLHRPAR